MILRCMGRRIVVICLIRMIGFFCGLRWRTPAAPRMTPRGGYATRWKTAPAMGVRTHTSARRPYGYARDGVTILEHEAVICGRSSPGILTGPHRVRSPRSWPSGEVTAGGNPWQPHSVRGILKQCH
jgi:hypothetical protein